MGLLTGIQINALVKGQRGGFPAGFDPAGPLIIEPFYDHKVRVLEADGTKVLSFGLGHCGYDLTLARQFKIFTNSRCAVIDPKDFDPRCFEDFEGDVCTIPPNSFVLARTVELIQLPANVCGLISTKSTYARCGINCPPTVAEPGWRGHLTLEIGNHAPLPAKLYAGEGVVQLLLMATCGYEPALPYQGKYQDQQAEIVTARV